MAQIWLELAGELYSRHSDKFTQIVGKPNGRRSFVEENDAQGRKHKQIKNSKFWIVAHGNSDSMVWRCKNLLRLLGYKDSDLIIHYE